MFNNLVISILISIFVMSCTKSQIVEVSDNENVIRNPEEIYVSAMDSFINEKFT